VRRGVALVPRKPCGWRTAAPLSCPGGMQTLQAAPEEKIKKRIKKGKKKKKRERKREKKRIEERESNSVRRQI
jgi:hypothetical protein